MKLGMRSKRVIAMVAVLLGLIGLAVSAYLSYEVFTSSEFTPCPVGGGCTAVLHSDYSKFLGIIPLAYMGVAYYLLVIILGKLAFLTKKQMFLNVLAYVSLVGFGSSIIFVGIQAFLIGQYCFYCLISAVTSTLLFLATLPILIGNNTAEKPKV